MSEYTHNYYNNVALILRIRGIKSADLARCLNLSHSYIVRVVSGERKITDTLRETISDALGCAPDVLTDEEFPDKIAKHLEGL